MRVAPLLLLLAAGGCAPRSAPYRFRGPVVSAVNVGELRSAGATAPARGPEPQRIERSQPIERHQPTRRPPRHAPAAIEAPGARATAAPMADALRALVGQRHDGASQLDFVRLALHAIDAPIGADVRTAADAAELMAVAERRGAVDQDGSPLLGDLAVFDGVVPGQPASTLGVVVAVDERGVVEFVYLGRGIVRRGFLNRDRRVDKRDAHGRVLNTIIRQEHGGRNKGVGDLAGQLHSAYVRLERLLAP